MVLTQEEILLSLVQGDEGKNWALNRIGWKKFSIEPACEWESVECDTHDKVISLLLSDTSLSASIPPEFGKLSSLKTLQMATNKLYGSLPSQFAALPYLVNLDLSDNRFTGTLPTFISRDIRTINLGHNDFHGSIPDSITSSTDTILQRLILAQNRLSGTLPDALSKLSNLSMLDISSNNLHGEIPDTIGNLHLLQHLHLNNNFLIGQIPATLATSHPTNGRIADLLEEIHLHDNLLSGTIPPQFADLPKLTRLLIHENKLTGDIPSDICSPTINSHFFQKLIGEDMTDIDFCDAISCPINYVAKEGIYPCSNCKNPHYNPYLGKMRSCNTFTNQRSILKKFYESTSVNGKWNGNDGDNWSRDDTFICDFTGVTCDENFNVIAIELKDRGLQGTIPNEIGFLKYLEKIDVSDNHLSGFLPSDFRWAPLKSMDISGNKIRGLIPPKLCLKGGLNGNGINGNYNCDHIACPVNTYAALGRRSVRYGHTCLPCEHNPEPVLGSKDCVEYGIASGIFGIVIVLVTLVLSVSMCYIAQYKKSKYHEMKDNNKAIKEIELGEKTHSSSVSYDTEDTSDNPSRNNRREQEPMVKRSMRDYQNTSPSTRSMMSVSKREIQHISSSTRNMLNASNLPYPEAAVPNRNVQIAQLNKHRSVRSTGSGSAMSGSGSAVSVASNKSGKFSIASDDSGNNRDVWLDVPNVS